MAKVSDKVTDLSKVRGAKEVSVDTPPPLIYCRGCTYWLHSGGSFGQCKASGRFLPQMMLTTDLTTCMMAVSKVE